MLMNSYCLLGLSALAIVQTPKPGTSPNENVRWGRTPDPEAVAQYTPYFSNLIAVPGRVQLRCVALFEGTPQNCQIVSVSPDGLGFEEAARLVTATGVIRPMIVNGETIPSSFNFTVNFQPEPIPVAPDPKYIGSEPSAQALKLAETIVRSFMADQVTDPWSEVADALDADRRETVLSWLHELFPIDFEEELRLSALGLARTVPEAELVAYLETGMEPNEPPAEEMAAAYGGTTLADIKALGELRARYCARWSCAIEQD